MVIMTSFRPIRGKARFHLRATAAVKITAQIAENNFFRLIHGDLGNPLQLGTSPACIGDNPVNNMKTNLLSVIASFVVLTTIAHATDQTQPEAVVLPTYVISAPRQLPVEAQINISLEKFRAQAQAKIALPFSPALSVAPSPQVVHVAGLPAAPSAMAVKS